MLLLFQFKNKIKRKLTRLTCWGVYCLLLLLLSSDLRGRRKNFLGMNQWFGLKEMRSISGILGGNVGKCSRKREEHLRIDFHGEPRE